jgi:hypothetical protein
MKLKTYFTIAVLCIFNCSYSQNFTGHASGTFGILNGKIRLQYENPLKDRASFGANLNYYLVNWKGPVLEPFIRIYGKKDGNEEGFFGQAKLIYGNLSTVDFDDQYVENKRWSTFGFGMSFGYKFLLAKHFTIEPLMGFRILSPPVYRYTDAYYNDPNSEGLAIGESIGWYLTTGLPFDFQLKFGYQF